MIKRMLTRAQYGVHGWGDLAFQRLLVEKGELATILDAIIKRQGTLSIEEVMTKLREVQTVADKDPSAIEIKLKTKDHQVDPEVVMKVASPTRKGTRAHQ